MTPLYLTRALVNHFKPSGIVLEPCKGTGNFIKALKEYDNDLVIKWCEISQEKDFFDFNEKVDWIITNPPWSKIRSFLFHSMEISDNVCFLFTINHLWTKARIRDMEKMNFGLKEICIFKSPDCFPVMGFQAGMVYIKKNYSGDIKFSKLKLKEK